MKVRRPIVARLLLFIGLAAIVLQAALVLARPLHYQWDTKAYYYAGVALKQGLNPYHPEKVWTEPGQIYPFLYPPHTLPLVWLLAALPLSGIYPLFLTVKLA